jgi:O-antigen/teichoic acid export membrane protein
MRRFVENYVFALSADVIQRVSAALLVVWVSRKLGVNEAGIYFLGLSFAILFGQIAYWGLDQLLTREVAREPGRANQFMVNFLVVRAGLAILMLSVLYGIVIGLGYVPHTSRVIMLLGLTILPDSMINICQSVFMAHEQMGYLTLGSLLNGVVRVVAGVLALAGGFGLEGVAVGLLLASVTTLVALLYLIRTRLFRPSWEIDWRFCRRQLIAAFPFLMIGMFFVVDNQLDVVLLSRLADEYQVGLYGGATTVVAALALIPFAFRTAVFPVMSRLYATAPDALGRLYDQSLKYLVLLGLPMAVGVTMLAPDIVSLVFGRQFAPSAPVLQILVWYLFLIFINVLNSRLLVVSDRQRTIAIFLLLGLIVNVALNMVLIPGWGAAGAAIARVVSTFVLFVVSVGFVFHHVYRFNPLPLLVRPAIAATIMAGSLFALRDWPAWVPIVAGSLIYFTVLLALRTFSWEDWGLWQQVMARYPAESEV